MCTAAFPAYAALIVGICVFAPLFFAFGDCHDLNRDIFSALIRYKGEWHDGKRRRRGLTVASPDAAKAECTDATPSAPERDDDAAVRDPP